ncbi:hypothetical protein M6B38_391620 [Iris pallida]|uniref:Maturase K n=1 Tax=Iris pallida TaxID=29817 RepID=A0AAX6FZZ2_IRIPA|nr:hypothetical protein M6B38_391620 [Iris pallida]
MDFDHFNSLIHFQSSLYLKSFLPSKEFSRAFIFRSQASYNPLVDLPVRYGLEVSERL